MEWDAPAIILDVRPYGEGDAVATVITRAHGLHRGLARGGAARAKAGTWQPGNMVQAQWTARLADQLGSFTGELIYAAASHAMQDAMPLSMLTAICAVAEGALPEREPLPHIFDGLLHLMPRLPLGDPLLTEVIQWEIALEGAADWATRLLPLPGFLTGTAPPDAAGWRDGLRLTGHFLARDAFGHQHRPLPLHRRMLYDRVSAMAA